MDGSPDGRDDGFDSRRGHSTWVHDPLNAQFFGSEWARGYCAAGSQLGLIEYRNGRLAIHGFCTECTDSLGYVKTTQELPRKQHPDWQSYPVLRSNKSGDVCVVAGCDSTDVELHHFAPRHLFADADRWPTEYICVEHHQEWHSRIREHV